MTVEIKNLQRKYRVNQRVIREKAETILSLCGLDGVELSLLFVNNQRISTLNKRYRGIDKPTDVLAFPMEENWEVREMGRAGVGPKLLGDIVISMEKTHSQARERGHLPARELLTLLTHGILHLIGYDHEGSPQEEQRMRRKEEFILKRVL